MVMPPIQPFLRLSAKYDPNGSVLVRWHLDQLFVDPPPHAFTLEGNKGGVASSDGWETLAGPADDVYELAESGDHHLGMYQDYVYRVRLTTSEGGYVSRVVHRPDPGEFRDWRISRDMVRKERLRHQLYTSLRGFLFRRRRGGALCPRCTENVNTGETDDRCPRCYGTGYLGGYFAPVYCDMQLEVNAAAEMVDPTKERGTTGDRIIQGCRLLGDPFPFAKDCFVDAKTDLRYFIDSTQEAAIVRSYPVVTIASVGVINLNDVVYDLSIPALPPIDRDELNPDTL